MKTLTGLIMVLMLLLAVSCGKKNSDSQPQGQGIVPTNVFAQIPGTKVGN